MLLNRSIMNMFLLLSLFFIGSLSSTIFANSPDVSFYTSSTSATEIKLSPYGDKVAIGFKNGNIQLYTTKGSWYYAFYGHSSKIIDI